MYELRLHKYHHYDGVMLWVSDSQSRTQGFDFRPFHHHITTWASCLHTSASVTKQ